MNPKRKLDNDIYILQQFRVAYTLKNAMYKDKISFAGRDTRETQYFMQTCYKHYYFLILY